MQNAYGTKSIHLFLSKILPGSTTEEKPELQQLLQIQQLVLTLDRQHLAN